MTGVPEVCIRYWAAARAAAGVAEDTVHAATLAEALAAVRRVRVDRPRLEAVMAISSFIVDGIPAGARDPAEVVLGQGSQVEVLPPYAGG